MSEETKEMKEGKGQSEEREWMPLSVYMREGAADTCNGWVSFNTAEMDCIISQIEEF